VAEGAGPNVSEIGVGVGIDSGEIRFGELGRSHRDLTAIGNVMNTAARSQSAAEAGQILVHPSRVRQGAASNGRKARPGIPPEGP
jgi:adenylate cyclase